MMHTAAVAGPRVMRHGAVNRVRGQQRLESADVTA